MVTQLSKEQTQSLERSSTPIIMLLADAIARDGDEFNSNKWFKVLSWKYANALTYDSLPKTVASMSAFLDHRPNYHINYEYRNAVWGLSWDKIDFVLYISKGGLAVQLAFGSSSADATALVNMLYDLLIVDSVRFDSVLGKFKFEKEHDE